MHEQHESAGAPEHLDPVCGMMVEEGEDAITHEHNGTTYYFCSKGCKRAFEQDPDKYLREGPSMKMG